MRLPALALISAACLALPACHKAAAPTSGMETAGKLAVGDPRLVLPIVSGNAGAAYFTLANGTDRAVRIAAIDVKGAGMAMMHETVNQGGHSEMQMLDSLPVPAHGSVVFAPGGKHLMLTGLDAGLKAGGSTEMTITFADGARLVAQLPVKAPESGQ